MKKDTQKRNIIYFILSLSIALALTYLLKEPSFTDSQVYVIFILFFSIGLWLTEAIPAFSVSLIIISYLTFALGHPFFNSAPIDTAKYAHTFSGNVIWLMLGGFFLASSMTKTKLDLALFRFTIKYSGSKPKNLLFGLMLTTMTASMLMSNTATSAMIVASIMPLLTTLGKQSKISKALLLGIAVAATLGGMGTIIGTPSNIIAVGVLENSGIKIEFLDWMMYGIPVSLTLTSISYFILAKYLIKDNTAISTHFLEGNDNNSIKSDSSRLVVIIVIIVTVGLWLTTGIHGLNVASICVVPLVILTLTRVLDGKDIQKLPWDTLLLVAGGLSLGLALEDTGMLAHYANKLIAMDINTYMLFIIFGFGTMIFSNIMSNTATSTVLIPLGIAIMATFKMEVALIIALSASSAMFLPVSTPPNAIVFSTGLIEQKDFRLGGILIGLLGPTIAIVWVLFLS